MEYNQVSNRPHVLPYLPQTIHMGQPNPIGTPSARQKVEQYMKQQQQRRYRERKTKARSTKNTK